ncbi:STAS domain-containing protein [Nevskia sp.]|uniref:STAS domain-containing protein n=1 Tax=Nevskia sp. TaxID=1929292 RepID=UPI0025D07A1F|nr:STAS domain-containing protein [Nevskia sp.]
MSAVLEGELSFARVPHWLTQADALASAEALDLSRVSRADSAGLALLLELSRRAQRQGHALRLLGAPMQLVQLATFFGLEGVLRFES